MEARWHRQLAEIPQQQWDALVQSAGLPFYRWQWLEALERSGSIVPDQGWQACHLSLWRGERLVGVAPLYLKGHSYGEFVFDQSFAQLAGQLGLRYYPKLLGMSPVSPVLGYRFFLCPKEDAASCTALMLELIDRFCERNQLLSCNFLYVDPAWRIHAEEAGCSPWLHQQSLWTNPGYAGFEDYLASFNANQRRNIRRERKAVHKAGLKVTLPRVRILEIFDQSSERHLSAEDIYKKIRDSGDEVGLATVYRVLTQFESAGILMKQNFEDNYSVYELVSEDHHDHMVCIDSGAVIEFKNDLIEEEQEKIAKEHGYEIVDHKLVLYVKPIDGKK